MLAKDMKRGTLYFHPHHGHFIVLSLSESYFSGQLFVAAELFFLGDNSYKIVSYYRVKEELSAYEKIADLDK
jgi:hypothetical protein